MLFRNSICATICKSIIISIAFIPLSYQQYALVGENLKYYSQTNLMSNTIQTFWHDTNVDCKIDFEQIIKVYMELINHIEIEEEDQFEVLLKHHIRKKLIRVVSSELVYAFHNETLKINEIGQYLENIKEKRIHNAIWKISIYKLYSLISTETIIDGIKWLKGEEWQALAFSYLINKCLTDISNTKTLMPLLAYHINTSFEKNISCNSTVTTVDQVYCRIPQELRFLYSNPVQWRKLINYYNLDYYQLNSDKIHSIIINIHYNGLVSFSTNENGVKKSLYAHQNQSLFFWSFSQLATNQLWQVIWPEYAYSFHASGFLMFENLGIKRLLCQGDNKPLLLETTNNMLNFNCYWYVKT